MHKNLDIWAVESTNYMSQQIGYVNVWLVITHTGNCAPPVDARGGAWEFNCSTWKPLFHCHSLRIQTWKQLCQPASDPESSILCGYFAVIGYIISDCSKIL